MTREDFLLAAIDALRPCFAAVDAPLPAKVYASVSFPSKLALSTRKRRVGECWNGKASTDGHAHVLVSPLLATGPEVLDTLMHELVHVVLPDAGHKAPFVALGRRLGLTEGKPTALSAGEDLARDLGHLAEKLGGYPHAALTFDAKHVKQSTRLLKVSCASCGYTCRVTRKWLNDVGAPMCPTHHAAMRES